MEIFLIAFALSMDSVALCVANGTKCKNLDLKGVFTLSFVYAFFQGFMPMIGYFLGASFSMFIASIDHFIAFGILLFLGVGMIKESRDFDESCAINLKFKDLIFGGIATSIDALAVGVTFAFSDVNIIKAQIIITITCFVLCVLGCYLGKKAFGFLEKKALVLGGVILIFIGTKILITHLGIFSL